LNPKKNELNTNNENKKGTNEKRNSILKLNKKTQNKKLLESTSENEKENENESEISDTKINSISTEPFCFSPFVSKRLCKALFCSGQLYVDSGIFDQALECYNRILEIDKNYPHVNLIL